MAAKVEKFRRLYALLFNRYSSFLSFFPDQWNQKTYVYHSWVLTGKRKTNSRFFSPACNAVSHDVEQNTVVLYPGFQRILLSYRYWWFAAKPRQQGVKRREKRMTSGHMSYESYFHAILGSKRFGLELMCMFVFMDADSWDLIVHESASDLLCMKNCAKGYLKRKVLLKIVTNSFPKKYTLGFKYIKRTDVSWEVPTLYGFRSQHYKKNFRSATLVLLY